MRNRKLRPWVKVAIAILVAAILAISFNLINTKGPCSKCGEPCNDEVAAVEGYAPRCKNCR